MNDASRNATGDDARFRAVFDGAALGVVLVDLAGRLVDCNATFARFIGSTVEELTGKSVSDLTPPEDWPFEQRRIREYVRSGTETLQFEKRYVHRDGGIAWARVNLSFLPDEDGTRRVLIGIVEDITDGKLAQQALKESEKTLRGLIENIPDNVLMIDRQLNIQYANRGTAQFSLKEMIGNHMPDFVSTEDRQTLVAALEGTFTTGRVHCLGIQDARGEWWAARFVPVADEGVIHHVMVIGTNITEQRKAEQAVCEEQELLRKMLDLFERDRELVAFEIHDGFSQQLSGAALNFEAAQELCTDTPEQAKSFFAEGLRLLRQSLDESRRLVRGLRPPVLDQFGIVPAIEHLIADHLAGGGVKVDFTSGINARRLARPLENALFRIVQEALNNIRQHSQSEHVRIELAERNGSVHLTVEDQGVGFDPCHVGADHFGLRGIRERARLLGGKAQINSSPGQGTRIRVQLPSVRRAASTDGDS
ncbi:MAG: PAS domain S-box protein [Pirellulales bacterium]|nr:PAS domain S-box protein [Pirellulales bacterium]